jgi:hypothetical protein
VPNATKIAPPQAPISGLPPTAPDNYANGAGA